MLKIPLNEPSQFRYLYINPTTNRVHLLVPFVAGFDVSTDNTCKSDVELNAFFGGGAFSELLTLRTERVNRPYFLAPALQSDSLVQSIYTL